MWHFCKSCDTLKIEKKSAIYFFNDFKYPYDILRHCANVPLFYSRRRKKAVLLEVYKAFRSYDLQYLIEMLKKQRDMTITQEIVKLLYRTNAILQHMGYRHKYEGARNVEKVGPVF